MNQASKSPFYVIPDFISPLMCEEIVDQLNFVIPDVNAAGMALPSTKTDADYEAYLFGQFTNYKESVAAYYDSQYRDTTEFVFNWFPLGASEAMHSENSIYSNGNWMRVKDRDITCVLFLSEYQDKPPFDDDYEVYGGKLEFPQHGFGFQAQRGTLIAFPSVPSFINGIAPILAGSLYFAKFHIATKVPLLYDPKKFPGNYVSWLREFA